MDNLVGFVWELLADARVMTVLLAAVAFFGRTQLTHWMSRDLETQKARHLLQLEQAKASYQRELESYRTSLIAQTEAIKAAQDVKRSMAIAVSSKQVEAMYGLQSAFTGRCVQLLTAYRRAPELTNEVKQVLLANWKQYTHDMEEASRSIASFAPHELQLCTSEILIAAGEVQLDLHTENLPVRSPEKVKAFEDRMFDLQMRLDLAVREYVAQVQTMSFQSPHG